MNKERIYTSPSAITNIEKTSENSVNYTTKFEYNSCVFFLFSSRCCCRFSALYSYKNSLLHSFIHSVPTSKNIYYYLFIQFFFFVCCNYSEMETRTVHSQVHSAYNAFGESDGRQLCGTLTEQHQQKQQQNPFTSFHFAVALFFLPYNFVCLSDFHFGIFFFSLLCEASTLFVNNHIFNYLGQQQFAFITWQCDKMYINYSVWVDVFGPILYPAPRAEDENKKSAKIYKQIQQLFSDLVWCGGSGHSVAERIYEGGVRFALV